MRDYLYLWKKQDHLVASGIEFVDLMPLLEDAGGLVLLRHDYDEVDYDYGTGLDYVARSGLSALAAVNIYSFGDFAWADYRTPGFPSVVPEDVAQLLYFAHAGVPLRQVSLTSLGNRLLVFGHDDGWRLSLYTRDWDPVRTLISDLVARLTRGSCSAAPIEGRSDDAAVWVTPSGVEDCEGTWDIDGVLNARISR